MNSETSITLHQTFYRGLAGFQVRWIENGDKQEKTFATEAEAVTEMAAIEERFTLAKMAGQGLTVNPFGMHIPFISSKDVNYAALKLQPRGLKFRAVIDDYVASHHALQGLQASVAAAAADFAEASHALKAYDVSLQQAVFEWLELKKQIGDRPLYEVLGAYLKMKAASASAPTNESPVAAPSLA